jgi:hypothetical protein
LLGPDSAPRAKSIFRGGEGGIFYTPPSTPPFFKKIVVRVEDYIVKH